jgi:LexA-binding, inner membrane-associated putative hydrolase
MGAAMFLGHLAAGLVASRSERGLPLGTALLASELPDAIWPWFLLAGVEKVEIAPGDTVVTPLRFVHYPWSHSLVMVLVWGLAMAFVYRRMGRTLGAAALLFVLAASHWVLDFVSHRADLPLTPLDGPVFGLGLWNSLTGTLLVEGLAFAAAVFVFARARRPGWRYWSLVAVVSCLYLLNLFGPPPPSTTAVAVSGIVLVPIVWWWGNRVTSGLPAVANENRN